MNFSRDEKVEVAAVGGSFSTMLGLADGSLMLENSKTAMGTVEPLARFGSSAFGPIRARIMSADGVTGDWMPLGTLVRLPGFKELRCPRAVAKPCTLTGTNLFLAASIGATPDLDNSTDVPEEFTGTQLSVPHPSNGLLYLWLRDDPETVQALTLPVTPITPKTQLQPPAQQTQPASTSAAHSVPAQAKPAAAAATHSAPSAKPEP
jgi:hypothetical protein